MQTTRHNVLAHADRSSEEDWDAYYFLACAGCDMVSMANLYNYGNDEDEALYYPSPISRPTPSWSWKLSWFTGDDKGKLGDLLREIHEAVRGKQYRLAVMGIRAFFEQLMVLHVGDHGSFPANLDAFEAGGFVSRIQKTAVAHILDAGHGVMHRMHKPTESDLNTALDIMESVTAAIFFHEEEAKAVSARVPPRLPKPSGS